MPKPSRIVPVYIPSSEWLKSQDPPRGSLEGHHFGTECVVIRYSTSRKQSTRLALLQAT